MNNSPENNLNNSAEILEEAKKTVENLSPEDAGKVEFSNTEETMNDKNIASQIESLPDDVSNEELLKYANYIKGHFGGTKLLNMMEKLHVKQYYTFEKKYNIDSFVLPRNVDKKQSYSPLKYLNTLKGVQKKQNAETNNSFQKITRNKTGNEEIEEKIDLTTNSFFLSEEIKEESFLETYKKDMLEAIYGFMTSYNKVSYKHHLLTDSVMKGIATILSNGSSAKDIQKLSLFLMDSTNIGSMSEITSFNKNNQNEMIDNLFGTLYNMYVEHKSNIDPEKDFVLDSDSPSRNILPNGFTFTTTEEELQKLVDLADQGSSNYVSYAENGSIRKNVFHLWPHEENKGKSVHVNLAADNDTKKVDRSTTINLNRYSTWRAYEGVDNTTNSMQTFINTPYRGSIVHLDDTIRNNFKNIAKVSLTPENFDKYNKILQERYPDLIVEKSLPELKDVVHYKKNVEYISNDIFIGKQEFFAGETQLIDQKTSEFINEDFVNSLNDQIFRLKSDENVDPNSIHVYIESSASHLPAPKGMTNQQLAFSRGENIQKKIIEEANAQNIPFNNDMFDIKSFVSGPEHDTSKSYTIEDIGKLEKEKYREHQYVKVSVQYNTLLPKDSDSSSTFDIPSSINGKNNIQLNSFSINIPPKGMKSDLTKGMKKEAKRQGKDFYKIVKNLDKNRNM